MLAEIRFRLGVIPFKITLDDGSHGIVNYGTEPIRVNAPSGSRSSTARAIGKNPWYNPVEGASLRGKPPPPRSLPGQTMRGIRHDAHSRDAGAWQIRFCHDPRRKCGRRPDVPVGGLLLGKALRRVRVCPRVMLRMTCATTQRPANDWRSAAWSRAQRGPRREQRRWTAPSRGSLS
jgi:hypothetical protein